MSAWTALTPGRVALSNVLGYASIISWLCAQLPQVVKNAKLQSCEGLALPFLVNWLFGDMTNLVGCLLTDQLPFQTWLAGYFCIIDFTLLIQFFHYQSLNRKKAVSFESHPEQLVYSSPHQSLLIAAQPSRQSLAETRRRSASNTQLVQSPIHKRPRTIRSNFPSTASGPLFPPDVSITSPPTDSYQAIYEAALDVARAAERAETRRSESMTRLMGHSHQDGERMIESFHSEMSAATSSSTASASEHHRRAMSQSTGALPISGGRGRSLRRDKVVVPTPPPEEAEGIDGLPNEGGQGVQMHERSKSRSLSLVRAQSHRGPGRRAAGVAFMSVGLLAGISRLAQPSPHGVSGIVLSPSPTFSGVVNPWPTRHPPSVPPPIPSFLAFAETGHDHPSFPHSDDPPPFHVIVGRISAWTCTTLYLTSRLPQIWKNFQRRSVEGLSILLFIFAFCGNVTYVISILLNPAGSGDPAYGGQYLLEALPYLLGSGGTLMFDLTIMIQSWVYGSAPPITTPSAPPSRRSRLRRRLLGSKHLEEGRNVSISTERQPLLSGTGQPSAPATATRPRSISPDVVMRRSSISRGPRGGSQTGPG